MTIHKYAQLAAAAGYLDAAQQLPEAAELVARLGPASQPPRTPSSVEPYREQVEQLLADGVEMMTIFDRLGGRGYTGSYSSIRRFVGTLKPANSRAVVRVHAALGEEAQVDFGSAGMLLDLVGSRSFAGVRSHPLRLGKSGSAWGCCARPVRPSTRSIGWPDKAKRL